MSQRRFLHPPRTGGRSIADSWRLVPPEYRGHDGRHRDDGWRYGFTRNPWDRAVSLFHLLHRGPVDEATFADWVVAGMPDADRRLPPALRGPTTDWLEGADWIGRFETREEDAGELAAMLGREPPMLRANRSAHRRTASYAEFYEGRSDAVNRIASLFRADVDAFGYSFGCKVLLHTVPGSGTRWIRDMLAPHVDEVTLLHSTARDADERVARFVRKGFRLVVPVRDPVATLITNANGNSAQSRAVLAEHTGEVVGRAKRYGALIVRVDRDEPSAIIRKLRRYLLRAIPEPETWAIRRAHHTPDRTGLKAIYEAGRSDPRLDALRASLGPVASLYREMGYAV